MASLEVFRKGMAENDARLRGDMVRRVRTVDNTLTDTEAYALAMCLNPTDCVFQQQAQHHFEWATVDGGKKRDGVRLSPPFGGGDPIVSYRIVSYHLEQIIETRNEIVKMEASVRELRQIFLDFAGLVDEQGSALQDDILHSMAAANKYVEHGVNDWRATRGAERLESQNRTPAWLLTGRRTIFRRGVVI